MLICSNHTLPCWCLLAARRWSQDSVWLHVQSDNAAAIDLYTSAGYSPVPASARLMDLIPGPWAQTLMMRPLRHKHKKQAQTPSHEGSMLAVNGRGAAGLQKGVIQSAGWGGGPASQRDAAVSGASPIPAAAQGTGSSSGSSSRPLIQQQAGSNGRHETPVAQPVLGAAGSSRGIDNGVYVWEVLDDAASVEVSAVPQKLHLDSTQSPGKAVNSHSTNCTSNGTIQPDASSSSGSGGSSSEARSGQIATSSVNGPNDNDARIVESAGVGIAALTRNMNSNSSGGEFEGDAIVIADEDDPLSVRMTAAAARQLNSPSQQAPMQQQQQQQQDAVLLDAAAFEWGTDAGYMLATSNSMPATNSTVLEPDINTSTSSSSSSSHVAGQTHGFLEDSSSCTAGTAHDHAAESGGGWAFSDAIDTGGDAGGGDDGGGDAAGGDD